jgi:hypothetical protein
MTPKDRIAFVIVAGLIGWGALTIVGLWFTHKSLTDAGGEIFVAIAGGLLSALGGYFAVRNGKGP